MRTGASRQPLCQPGTEAVVTVRVLVVEDHPKMRALVSTGLRGSGYAVDAVGTGVEALHRVIEYPFDTVVLDVMLPGMDGISVLQEMRRQERWTPVLLLTARDSIGDRVTGLDAGADDYLVKPFAMEELLGRVRALVRRGAPARPAVLSCGPLAFDPASRLTSVNGKVVPLSAREASVLEYLLRRQGSVVTRTELLDHVWDSAYDGGSNVVDVYVKYLRDKIDRPHGLELISTVRGVGYRLGGGTQ